METSKYNNGFKKNHKPWNKGKKNCFSPSVIRQMSVTRKGIKQSVEVIKKRKKALPRGEKNWIWKGDKVGYHALHGWLTRNYGQSTTCEHCQKSNLTEHQIHWANISGNYKRDRTDFLRLCVKCHSLFDKRTPDFCECGNRHYSKGMCKKCYIKNYRKTHKRYD